MLRIVPQAIGANPLSGNAPQNWFTWGRYIVIEPVPDVATYDLAIYASCYPAAEMTADSDTPASLPPEFHECVYLFARAYANLKLRRWGAFSSGYNAYIADVQGKKYEYILKHPDPRASSVIPEFVEVTHG
jgi:hypothetical protein